MLKSGLVVRDRSTYSITAKGKEWIDTLSSLSKMLESEPKKSEELTK